MIFATPSLTFPAKLYTAEGMLAANGEAFVSLERQCIEFRSDFVPLYPLGTPMTIYRLHEKKQIHEFCGKVYLSSKKLMRLVSVQDTLHPGAEELYHCDVNISASLNRAFEVERRNLLPFLSSKLSLVEEEYEIRILALTTTRFEFEVIDTNLASSLPESCFEIGHTFHLCVNDPFPFSEAEIVIEQQFLFGTGTYLGKFIDLTEKQKNLLSRFLYRRVRTQRLF